MFNTDSQIATWIVLFLTPSIWWQPLIDSFHAKREVFMFIFEWRSWYMHDFGDRGIHFQIWLEN